MNTSDASVLSGNAKENIFLISKTFLILETTEKVPIASIKTQYIEIYL